MSATKPEWNFAGVADRMLPGVRDRLLTLSLLAGSLGGSVMLTVSAVVSPGFDVRHPLMLMFVVLHLLAVVAAALPRWPHQIRTAILAGFCLLWSGVVVAYVGPVGLVALFFVFLTLLAGFLYGAVGLFGCFALIVALYAGMGVLWVQGYLPMEGSHRSDPHLPSFWIQSTASFLAGASMICGLVYFLLRRTTQYFAEETKLKESLLHEQTLRAEAEVVRLRADLARGQAEHQLATLYRTAPIGLAFIRDRRFVLANEWVARLLGRRVDELVGCATRELYSSAEEYERVGRALVAAYQRGEVATVETEWLAPSGEKRRVLLTAATLDANHADDGAVVTVTDITAINEAHQAVRESEARLSEIFDHTSDIIFSVAVGEDGQFRVERANRAVEHYGFNLAQLNSGTCTMADLLAPDVAAEVEASFARCVHARVPQPVVRSLLTAAGLAKFSTTLVPVFHPLTRRAVRLVGFTRDITHTERIAELQQAKAAADAANRAKSAFLSKMSHEIRTPLNAVLGFTRLLLRDERMDDRQRTFLETVDRNGEHLLSLVNDVLEISTIEAAKVVLRTGPFSLHDLLHYLEATFAPAAASKGLRFVVHRAPEVPAVVSADEGKIRQILVNLVGNAVKFTTAGSVDLRVGSEATPRGWRLRCEVADTGAGLSPAELDAIFVDFEQTELGRRSGGSGLGLSISRAYAQLMGGDITVQSAPGHGSVFTLTLRCEEGADMPPAVHGKRFAFRHLRLAMPDRPVRLLVVDDVSDNRLLLTALLRETGFDVREATTGQEAVHAVVAWQPHAALIDMKMPDLDGVGVTRLIRSMSPPPRLKILGVSASVFSGEASDFLAAGADAFLAKPVRDAEILATLGRLLSLEYESDSPGPAIDPDRAESRPDPGIDESRRAALAAAVDQADYGLIDRLVEEWELLDPGLALRTRRHLQRFDYEAIRRELALPPTP
jgi:PAS domain S-box-containing protein